MKKGIHAENQRLVIFRDNASGAEFLIPSAVETTETGTYEGKEYPLYIAEVSSASHPVYTGKEQRLDTAGRADKFRKKMERAEKMGGNKKADTPKQEKKEEATEEA